jgi:hypothetical protein
MNPYQSPRTTSPRRLAGLSVVAVAGALWIVSIAGAYSIGWMNGWSSGAGDDKVVTHRNAWGGTQALRD